MVILILKAASRVLLLASLAVSMALFGGTARASGPLYVVDKVTWQPEEGRLEAVGWLVPAEGRAPVAQIDVLAGGSVWRTSHERVRRQDVVSATGRQDAFESGWRLRVERIGADDVPPSIRLAFKDAEGGTIVETGELAVAYVPPVPGALKHRLFSWFFALLCLAAAALFWRDRHRLRDRALSAQGRVGGASRAALIAAMMIVSTSFAVSLVVPPFQSPDEFDHLRRASMVSSGQWLMSETLNGASGGQVDVGLTRYMKAYRELPFSPGQVITQTEAEAASIIPWEGKTRLVSAPGTGFYLPLIYAPQAAALALGRWAGASVDASYRLARLACLLVAALCVFEAFRRVRPSLLQLLILLLPMSLFQWASASIDTVSTALTLLALALTVEVESQGRHVTMRRFCAVALLVIIVVGSRIHLAPLLLLPVWLAWRWPWRLRVLGALPTILVGAWVLFALKTTAYPKLVSMSATDKLMAYAQEPGRLVDVFWTTTTTPEIMDFYYRSFVGVLGWLDTPLSAAVYSAYGVMLVAALSFSLVTTPWREGAHWRYALLGLSAVSVMLVPLLLLLMWTPFGSQVVEGVQGRYFHVPMLIAAMAFATGADGPVSRLSSGTATTAAGFAAIYALAVLLPTLVFRYYT